MLALNVCILFLIQKELAEIGNIIKKTKIIPDYINVGGGFPTIYPDLSSTIYGKLF